MNHLNLTPEHGKPLYQQQLEHDLLQVRELEPYRWFYFNHLGIQSILDLTQPHRIVSPVYQSMLIFLLWKNTPLKLLNLGMGAGAFERFFATLPNINVTSVEQSQPIIDMAKTYFYLPETTTVVNQSAEGYLAAKVADKDNNNQIFDIVLIDIYSNKSMSPAIFSQTFYLNLQQNMAVKGVAAINLIIDNDKVLADLLQTVRHYFDYCVLLEFSDYGNLILLISNVEIPAKDVLFKKNKQGSNITYVDFEKIIKAMHYLPVKE